MPSAEREKCGAFFSRLRHNLLCSFYLEQIKLMTNRHQEREVSIHTGLGVVHGSRFWQQKQWNRVLLVHHCVKFWLKIQGSQWNSKMLEFASRFRHPYFVKLEQFLNQTRLIKNENILKKYFSFCRHEVELFFDEKVRIEVSFIP